MIREPELPLESMVATMMTRLESHLQGRLSHLLSEVRLQLEEGRPILRGRAPSESARAQAVQVVRELTGIQINQIEVV